MTGSPITCGRNDTRRPEDGAWGAPVVTEGGATDAFAPEVEINPEGRAFAAWRQGDGTVWVNRSE